VVLDGNVGMPSVVVLGPVSVRQASELPAGRPPAPLTHGPLAEGAEIRRNCRRDVRNVGHNYRLKRIQKGKPLKKTDETDAIFAHVRQVREQV
jgi:hypothetical protein